MTINPAYRELIDLAAAMRGPDWARALEGALNASRGADWPFLKAYAYTFRLLTREDAHPQELREECTNPLRPAPPPGAFEAAAEIRAAAKARMAEAQAAGPRVTADTPQRAKREPAA